MKILITGGHVTPARAVIDELTGHEIIFVGRKFVEGKLSLEYQEISKSQIKFYNLVTGRLSRIISLKTFLHLLLIPVGFIQALFIIARIRPDRVLSFGGYLALPVAFWARIFGIKVFTHEQTINPGLANRMIAKLSEKIFVSFEQTKDLFPQDKVVVSGNPLRKEIFKVIKKPFALPQDRKAIYITGGSLGAHSINLHIKNILDKLLEEFTVIHQTGDTKNYDDYGYFSKIKNKYYFPVKHLSTDDLGYVYKNTDLVVTRAGANTFFELIVLKIPAILIPLPWSANQEQQMHAQILKNYGAGEIFDQAESSERLYELIKTISNNINKYKNNFSKIKINTQSNAANLITKEILQ
jgi:UDP-N-acetylglucosamine--N-acetylmuramyl-(pentapeptide) pyrophosphoryl-undecaprenol N-acetylglucosamine transferase